MAKANSPETSNLSTIVPSLILASTSPTRMAMLKNAGLIFTAQKPLIDEQAEQNLHRGNNLAMHLAKSKALSIDAPNHIILGADQTLRSDETYFHKASSHEEAKQQLQAIRGKTHILTSAVVLAHGGKIIWEYQAEAHMTMRNMSDHFIENYLATNTVLGSVGCYHIEGEGLQLFDKIEGDYFTILGLPLLPCLNKLRSLSLLAS
jgi:septum formation protein